LGFLSQHAGGTLIRAGEINLAFRGQHQSPRRAVKKPHAEAIFELAH
jgi:hypothetical protein